MKSNRINISWPHSPPGGGPGTFQTYMIKHGAECGVHSVDSDVESPDVIFVNIGTRRLFWLWRMKRKGVKVLHRLDGVVWREYIQKIGLRAKLRSFIRDFMMSLIRRFFADIVIYQSEFVKAHWERARGAVNTTHQIIYNGVDTELFSPSNGTPADKPALLCVEGQIQKDSGVIEVIEDLSERLVPNVLSKIILVGGLNEEDRDYLAKLRGVDIRGKVAREAMPSIYREADVFLNLEVNPPCPNAVLEAMSSGLPVVAYDTGAARELIGEDAGKLVPFGADPWRLETPDVSVLAPAVCEIASALPSFSEAARARVLSQFSIGSTLSSYSRALHSVCE